MSKYIDALTSLDSFKVMKLDEIKAFEKIEEACNKADKYDEDVEHLKAAIRADKKERKMCKDIICKQGKKIEILIEGIKALNVGSLNIVLDKENNEKVKAMLEVAEEEYNSIMWN